MFDGEEEKPVSPKKFSTQILLQPHVDRHEDSRTKEGFLNLLKLDIGDHVKVSFYPNDEYMVDHPDLYLAITEKPDAYHHVSAVGSGGPDAWNDQPILIDGSALSPNVRMIKPARIEAGLYVRYKIFDPVLAEKQRANEAPVYTALGQYGGGRLCKHVKT